MQAAVGAVLAAVTIGAGVVPAAGAAGAATALAARTPAAPPGYHRVISAPIPVPPGQLDAGGQVACPAGTVPWGGGTGLPAGSFADFGDSINTSAPAGDGWEGRYNNTSQSAADFRVQAICARKPTGYTTAFTTVGNPAHSQSAAIAVCPTGTRLLSGGTLSTADTTDVQLLSAWPLDRHRFESVMWNGSAAGHQLTTFAICASKPPGYTITSSTVSDGGGPSSQLSTQACPAGTSILGGGINVTSPRPAVTPGASLTQGRTAWQATVANSATAPATVAVYAICAA
jgi:hypothetical protein